jgi:two-component system phosphate regulon response regulator PhoB
MNKSKPLVLVVEDEAALQEAARLKLAKEGIEPIIAGTGEEGLEILKKRKPDLIWLDILLPGMNGLEFLHQVRENPDTKDLPVIILSVSSGPEKVKQAFTMNVVDYLVKNEYTIEKVVGKVKNILRDLKPDETKKS